MHFRKLLFIALTFLMTGQLASAQVKRCLTPDIKEHEAFENWLQDVKSSKSFQRLAVTGPYEIPVIVHIIYNEETVGMGSNISLEQVISQFKVLNADFKRLNADTINTPPEFQGNAGKMDISFLPAIVNETGDTLAEPGVNRINRNNMFFNSPPYASAYIESTIKPATIWDPEKYFNIWVLDFSEALGYAQPPVVALPDLDPSADANLDGVVVRYTAFGTVGNVEAPWNKGRVATHETGHWLGLYHIWGQSDNDACGEDDYVVDTPNQDEPSQFCPSMQGPACPGVTREMWENYMDYTWDQCMNLFTNGQVDRMKTVIENAPRRASLLTSDVAGKFDQGISFGSLAEVTYGDPDFELSAVSGSGLPIEYSSLDPEVATLSGSTVTIVGAGSTMITVTQQGNYLFNPAEPVMQLLVVVKADQIITFEEIPALTYGEDPYELLATATSGLNVIFSCQDPAVSISGNTLTILGAGEATIEANQEGDGNYNAAPPVIKTIEIQKAGQMITFEPLDPVVYGSDDFIVSASSGSGLSPEYLSSNTTVATVINDMVSIHNAGETTIKAYQEGNENYTAADTVEQLLVVRKADQNVTLDSITFLFYSDPDFTIRAQSDSGLPVTIFESSNPMIIAVIDSIAQITGVGEVIIKASQEGNENYSPAVDSQLVMVDKGIQNWLMSGIQDYPDDLDTIPLSIQVATGDTVLFDIEGPVHYEENLWLSDNNSGRVTISAHQPGSPLYYPKDTIVSFCILPSPEITVSGDSLFSNYPQGNTWVYKGDTLSFDGSMLATRNGDYTLIIIIEGCTSQITYSDFVVDINVFPDDRSIILFPNPVNDHLALEFSGQIRSPVSYTILDLSGRRVTDNSKIIVPNQKIDVSHLIPGEYFLQIMMDEKTFIIRFIKN